VNRDLKQLLKGVLLAAWAVYFVAFCFITVMWLDQSIGYVRDGGRFKIGRNIDVRGGRIIIRKVSPGVPGATINQRLSGFSSGLPIWDYTFQEFGPFKSYSTGQGYVFQYGIAMPFEDLLIPILIPWLMTLPSPFTGPMRVVIAKRWAQLCGLKKKSRYRQGLCRKCGYDMRATPNRCPECGVEAQAP
jgi:hypothetical protein